MDLWNHEEPISDLIDQGLDIAVPDFIRHDISPYQIASIVKGGCASGAYMPAVTYNVALDIMSEHGDDVLQYLEDALGALPKHRDDISWAGLACFYLSEAVELWAASVAPELEAFEIEDEE